MMDIRQAFLADHAQIHSRETTGSEGVSLQDGLCEELTDEQLRLRPDGLNSIAWILWHITRFEDLVVNTVLRGVPEVLDRDGWQERLAVGTRLLGTGGSDDEVNEFSALVDVPALRAYRAAVGRETRAWATGADFDVLDDLPDISGRLSSAPPSLDERGAWVPTVWQGRTGRGLLSLPVLAHSLMHIGEARVTRARLGAHVR